MRLFEEVVAAGKHLAFMAHYSLPRELRTPVSEAAVKRIQATGASIRAQAPLIRNVNDNADVWAAMWQKQVDLGIIPYYMFVERDTGPKQYFEVPLYRAFDIFTRAVRQLSGLGRTVRGPSMSCTPGKVLIDGIAEIDQQRVFVLKFLQGRDPHWTNRVFFAQYDESACWIDDLQPAFADQFFFEEFESNRRWNDFAMYSGARKKAAKAEWIGGSSRRATESEPEEGADVSRHLLADRRKPRNREGAGGIYARDRAGSRTSLHPLWPGRPVGSRGREGLLLGLWPSDREARRRASAELHPLWPGRPIGSRDREGLLLGLWPSDREARRRAPAD